MSIYFTSDLHFDHKRIMEFCPNSRKLANGDIKKMNQLLLDGINGRVTEEDTLYILGDFSFTASPRKVEETLMAIRAKELHLIVGNHDQTITKNRHLQKYFTSVSMYREIYIGQDKVVMMHYPIESWNGMHRGSIHLHGHCHSRNDELNTDNHRGELRYLPRRFDVGIDSREDFKPWKWEEIHEFIINRESKTTFKDIIGNGI